MNRLRSVALKQPFSPLFSRVPRALLPDTTYRATGASHKPITHRCSATLYPVAARSRTSKSRAEWDRDEGPAIGVIAPTTSQAQGCACGPRTSVVVGNDYSYC